MTNRYDDAVRVLCADDLAVICAWLGVPVPGPAVPVRLSEAVPAPTTQQVDLLAAVGDAAVVHVEFQSGPESHFPARMLGYWLRLFALKELEGREIHQHVVLLGDGRIPDRLLAHRLDYSYEVHRLRDEDAERFLGEPALAPFAALANVVEHDRPAVFQRALRLIASVEEPHRREVLARAAADLALIRLDPATIDSIWKETVMPIPSLYEFGHVDGWQAGREEGREEGLTEAVTSLLRIRFGDRDGVDAVARRLASLGIAEALARIERADSFDGLAD